MRALMILTGTLLALYVGYLALLYFSQRSMMFPGTGLIDHRPHPPGVEAITLEASFGEIHGILMQTDQPGRRPALLYFHGNAELAVHNIDLLRPLTQLGMAVLLVEYPGYAGSGGSPSRESLAETARRSYDWLAEQPDIDAMNMVVVGRSIGSGPAVELASERSVAALVLLSPFSTMDAFARSMAAPGFLIRDRYDNQRLLHEYPRPVLIFHGRRDRIIPYRHSEALLQSAPNARLITMDCAHNDCPYFDADFMGEVESFLRDAGVLPGG